ncbi:helix-turn-helix transcriptional regulator [Paenibacillus glucanolyticus]|uniref:helix-turn-helix transcriptional regulator n=1 Tax=Paenibacillus glucanolyticus TaxID=59843 RepID=UPI00097004AD|nr:AraC family transcriptional regulator [Paenibacillus glucanolyticus]MPY18945.1 helix-turn-helix transcriptional regulator [Paenibacillus glucanolyticus]OMF74393.1 AraC family transcriptional regulator [Paenibacillus glucanolyticus]
MGTPVEVRQVSGVDWYEEADPEQGTWHLSLVTYGKCVYWVNGDKLIMEKGELLLIPAGVPYYGKSIPTVTHTQIMVQWTEALSTGLSVLERAEALKHKPGCYELIHERLKVIHQQWHERPSYYVILIEALLTEVLIYISRELDRGAITPEKHLHVERMKSYIERHYREKITKEELGDAIAKTPNYAAVLFKSVTGQTISQYVHAQRMKRAAYLLTESQLTVQEIAEFLGYQDLSYFYRIYRRVTGSAPSDLLQERPRTV